MAQRRKTHEVEKASTAQRAPQPQEASAAWAANGHARPADAAVALQRAAEPSTLRPADVLALQRAVGNRAVGRMLSRRPHARPSQASIPADVIQRQPEADEEEALPEESGEAQLGGETEEGEPLQAKFDVAQRQMTPEREEESLRGDPAAAGVVQRFPVSVEARGKPHNIRGGTWMRAKVGAESEWAYGSGPPGNVPNLLTKVGAYAQGKQRYIAGHLLNDNMGGLGVNNNLTVLSSDANKRHRGVEGKVKKLAQQADLINSGNTTLGDPAYDHGARYTVKVLPPSPAARVPFAPQEKYIGAGLEISIKPIRIRKSDGAESPWPEEVGGVNDLTDHVVANVPPYPAAPPKKKPTVIQKKIVNAIAALIKAKSVTTFPAIWAHISSKDKNPPTMPGVRRALKKGVSSRFFSKRGEQYKVILKNIK